MEEMDYNAVLGLEGAEAPAEGPEAAAAPGAPAASGTAGTPEPAGRGQGASAPAGGGPPEPQAGKTGGDQAKARAEAQPAAARRGAEERRTLDQLLRHAGPGSPHAKAPIAAKAAYDAYQAQRQAQRQGVLEKTGMTPEEYQRFVANLPEVQAARQARAAAEQAVRAVRAQEARAKVEEQLRAVQALDPAVRSLRDLTRMETYPQLYEMVKRGYAIADAYKLANYEALTARAAAASRQAAVNAVQSKQHLTSTRTRGEGAMDLPESVLEEYRALNPGASREEIQRHYQNYIRHNREA